MLLRCVLEITGACSLHEWSGLQSDTCLLFYIGLHRNQVESVGASVILIISNYCTWLLSVAPVCLILWPKGKVLFTFLRQPAT